MKTADWHNRYLMQARWTKTCDVLSSINSKRLLVRPFLKWVQGLAPYSLTLSTG